MPVIYQISPAFVAFRAPFLPPKSDFTGSLSDTVATSDSYTAAGDFTATLSDTVATSENYTETAISESMDDTVATSDSYTAATFAPSASLSDTVATSDSYTAATFAATGSLSDTVATSDAYTPATFVTTGTLADTVATSDSYTAVQPLTDTVSTGDAYTVIASSLSMADSVATSDSYTGVGVASGTLADTVATSDSYTATGIGAGTLADTVATSDAYTASTFAATGTLSDTTATSDIFTGTATATGTLADTVATSDSYELQSEVLADTLVTSDAYTATAFSASATLADTVATSDSYSTFSPQPPQPAQGLRPILGIAGNVSTVHYQLGAAVPDGIALAQQAVVGPSLVINGSLATNGVATMDIARRVSIASSGADSAVVFTITGTDRTGNKQSEALKGVSSGSPQYSVLDYLTTTSVTVSTATAGAITVGTNSVGSSPWVVDDFLKRSWALAGGITGPAGTTYTLEHTYNDPNGFIGQAEIGAEQWSMAPGGSVPPHVYSYPGIAGANGESQFVYAGKPIFAHRLTINSGTGLVTMDSIQEGIES